MVSGKKGAGSFSSSCQISTLCHRLSENQCISVWAIAFFGFRDVCERYLQISKMATVNIRFTLTLNHMTTCKRAGLYFWINCEISHNSVVPLTSQVYLDVFQLSALSDFVFQAVTLIFWFTFIAKVLKPDWISSLYVMTDRHFIDCWTFWSF